MNRNELVERWRSEERQPFSGWDFAHLDGRMESDPTPWSYEARAAELMRGASSVLDMGTGGGERLLKLREHWPGKVAVTEDYPPNVKIATERLAPLGVRVADTSLAGEDRLPFAGGEFDLVLNRHSGFDATEVARILAPGGSFLTQQIHGLWAHDLLAEFGATSPYPDDTPEKVVPRLTAAGLTIADAREWCGSLTFTDVGAIVYYLRAVPWLVPGFSVATHLEPLLALQLRLERGESLCFAAIKFVVEALKGSRP